MNTTISFSKRTMTDLANTLGRVVGNKISDISSGSSDTSKTNGIDTNAILNSIKAKAQEQVDKKQIKTDKMTAEKDALSDLKSISSNLSSAIKTIKATGSSNIFNSLATTGAPTGATITTTSSAAVGSHTMSVASVASKQTIIIQSKDALGNPKPFQTGIADVTTPAVPTGAFSRGNTFRIHSNSNSNNAALATITIPNDGQQRSLQDIANLINASAANTVLIATIQTDSAGDKLVLKSLNAGTANCFYIDDQDITGFDRNNNGFNSAINQLSVTPLYNDVKSIDIYNRHGNTFQSPHQFQNQGDAGLFQAGDWRIGSYSIHFEAADIQSLQTVVTCINSQENLTGVTAEIVNVNGGGYIIRVTSSNNTPLNYRPEATTPPLAPVFQGDPRTYIRPSTASDTNITVDGVSYNTGGSLTIANPNPDIASVTVSAPTPLTTFSITQDATKLTAAITTLVDTINNAQQFIFQQREEEAPLLSNNTLNQFSSMINNLASNSTNAMSLSRMGITWTDYIPTSAEKKEGMVPARYLSINTTTLNNVITSNFEDVKGFFAGTLSDASNANASAKVSSMNKILPFSQFDLNVQYTQPGPARIYNATASNYGGGAPVNLTVVHLGGDKLLISGVTGTIFEGLSINYTHTGAGGLANLQPGAQDIIPGIKVYNGASLKLSTSLTSYLDVYGPLEKAITDKQEKIIARAKETKNILEKKDKKLAQAQVRINKIRLQTMMLESLRKNLSGNKN